MANSYTLLTNLRAGRCSNTAEVHLLKFWEARNINKGEELMSIEMLLIDEAINSLIPSNAFSPEDMATEEPCDIACRFCDGLLAIQDYPQGFPRPVFVTGQPNSFMVMLSTETQRVLTRETIQRAFHATEVGLASHVSKLWSTMPSLATVGTCSFVGEIKGSGEISAIQLSSEHNATMRMFVLSLRTCILMTRRSLCLSMEFGELRGSSK
ncbi:hypothetical protein HID58_030058 [Brassica napus]|uniref:Uncharacterized protein n=1 Tax=Brassica napus TaxID=3708 RepID=A0ABQ8CEU4_BRANA|nr:hypothetical protein HID58_030058 [Brassica napus]